MVLTIICPNLRCRSVLQVPDGIRGQKVRCGKCGKNFLVPLVTPAAAPKTPLKPAEAKGEKTAS